MCVGNEEKQNLGAFASGKCFDPSSAKQSRLFFFISELIVYTKKPLIKLCITYHVGPLPFVWCIGLASGL